MMRMSDQTEPSRTSIARTRFDRGTCPRLGYRRCASCKTSRRLGLDDVDPLIFGSVICHAAWEPWKLVP